MGEKEEVLRQGNISLVLDSYNDLFSDFDPRNYSERALSDDFLAECKRAARDQESGEELRLMLPSKKRNMIDELKIKKRLKTHFQKHFHEKSKEAKAIKKDGFFWVTIGVFLMILGVFFYAKEGIAFHMVLVILEPAGWFLFWEGLDKILIETKKINPDLKFYKKMTNAKISFISYSA